MKINYSIKYILSQFQIRINKQLKIRYNVNLYNKNAHLKLVINDTIETEVTLDEYIQVKSGQFKFEMTELHYEDGISVKILAE